MYTLKPLTERAKRVRERYRNTEPKVCIARYRLVTEFYQEHPQLRGILKRAYAMKHIFDNLPLRVEDDDVIVGALGTTFRSCAVYPEYSIGTLAKEIASGNISSRKYDPYLIDPEDGQYIIDTADFWEKESMRAIMAEYNVNGFMAHTGSGTTTRCSSAADRSAISVRDTTPPSAKGSEPSEPKRKRRCTAWKRTASTDRRSTNTTSTRPSPSYATA